MARMHSGKKGKSGSTRPSKPAVPAWVPLKNKEIEMLIVKLAKEGRSSANIGLILRDQYGVPDAKLVTGKSITTILKEKKLSPELPEDLMALVRKAVMIRKHLEENHKDEPAKRGLLLTESKVMRLVKYYKNNKVLAQDWKYDPKTIKLLVD